MLNVQPTARVSLLLLSMLILNGLCWVKGTDDGVPKECTEEYRIQTPTHTRCLHDNPECHPLEVSEADKQTTLAKHNAIRKEPKASNMMKLQWSEELAKTATKWAMQGKGGHDSNRNLHTGAPVGQNAFGGSGSKWTLPNAVDPWANEKPLFNYTHYNFAAGHYQAIINAKTYELGCGGSVCTKDGKNWTRWVCNYFPPVYSNANAFNMDEPCQDCATKCNEDFLCDCEGDAPTCNIKHGRLNPSTCKCDCYKMYEDGNTCDIRTCPMSTTAYYDYCTIMKPGDFYCSQKYYQKACPFACGTCTSPGQVLG